MKIGILTLPFNNNYGGYLQAYALMTVLKQMGHKVELINRRPNKRPYSMRLKFFIKSLMSFILCKHPNRFILDQEKDYKKKGINMHLFVGKYISPQTKPVYTSKQLRCYASRYDVIIVGSDQVWRPEYVPNIGDFFLGFCENNNTIKIAYAASFGERNPKYSDSDRILCGNLLSQFDAIGLREESGKNVIKEFGWHIKGNAHIVLDPTMLLHRKHYESLLDENGKETKYIFSYVLDESVEAEALLQYISDILILPQQRIISNNWKSIDYKMPSIESWLTGIKKADFVMTDSFHGTVFSIIFNIPFVVYVNANRGADRFYSLLKTFGLESRIVANKYDIDEAIKAKINWNEVNAILAKEAARAKMFLKNAIGQDKVKN